MTEIIPQVFSVLPLRDIVVFPGMIVPLFVGRDKSISAIEDVSRTNIRILLVTQKNASDDEPRAEDIYRVGVVANILQLLKLPDGTVKVLVEGHQRIRVKQFIDNQRFFQAEAEILNEDLGDIHEVEALSRSIIKQFEDYLKLNKKIPPEILNTVSQIQDAAKLSDTVASHLALKISDKQKLLETQNVARRLELLYTMMETEISVLNTERRIRSRVKRQMEKTQKEYYLNEQIKAIQKELGEAPEGMDELRELEEKIKKTKFSKEARDKAKAELKKLKMMSPMSAESTVVRNYLDWLLAIPWKKRSRVKSDVKNAEKVLEHEHYGLEKVKERIVEYLAVMQRTKHMKGQILCLVGPPGVGKTSLAQS
ncbi:MAG: LON peptidase substrate-binding domain-containing protein, partial [Rickettsiales bacterium]|nr:LON peptidase substrate-binding domain-containing protein [Rickettsiales bacterium]